MHEYVRIYIQWGHGWTCASDINKVQHQQDETQSEEEERKEQEVERYGIMGRVEGMVSREAGGWLGGRVRGGADIGHRQRGRPPGPCLRPRQISLPLRPFSQWAIPSINSLLIVTNPILWFSCVLIHDMQLYIRLSMYGCTFF